MIKNGAVVANLSPIDNGNLTCEGLGLYYRNQVTEGRALARVAF